MTIKKLRSEHNRRIWDVLARKVYATNKQFDDDNDLNESIRDAWDELSPDLCCTLINSMPNRLFEVIKNRGASINYGSLAAEIFSCWSYTFLTECNIELKLMFMILFQDSQEDFKYLKFRQRILKDNGVNIINNMSLALQKTAEMKFALIATDITAVEAAGYYCEFMFVGEEVWRHNFRVAFVTHTYYFRNKFNMGLVQLHFIVNELFEIV